MNRRNFGKRLATHMASAGSLLGTTVAAAEASPAIARVQSTTAPLASKRRWPDGPHGTHHALIKPARLQRGDLVGLIAPSGVMDDATIQKSVINVESMGFKVKLSPNIRAVRGGYAGTVAQRLDDLHGMFRDHEVKAIWAARGGSGCSGLLPGIRYDLIRQHPKILIGYSDITALHLAIHRMTGLVTFHGPVAPSTQNDYALTQLAAVLMEPRAQTEINMSIENKRREITQPEFTLRTLRAGVATGRLIGGNLSVLAALIGTPYAAQFKNNLVFLEDVHEPPYKVDRMLTQLDQQQHDALSQAAGVILGVFTKANSPVGDATLTLDEVIDDHLAALPIPAVYGYSFGHIPHQFTIPYGVMAKLDTENQILTLLESAVSE